MTTSLLPQTNAEKRADAMRELRSEGWSFQAIGDTHGVTRQRVHQIISCKPRKTIDPEPWLVRLLSAGDLAELFGVSRRTAATLLHPQRRVRLKARVKQSAAAKLRYAGWTWSEIAAALGYGSAEGARKAAARYGGTRRETTKANQLVRDALTILHPESNPGGCRTPP